MHLFDVPWVSCSHLIPTHFGDTLKLEHIPRVHKFVNFRKSGNILLSYSYVYTR